jgi:hypothetical protein
MEQCDESPRMLATDEKFDHLIGLIVSFVVAAIMERKVGFSG